MDKIPDTVSAFLLPTDAAQAADPALLTWQHPRFPEFAGRLNQIYEEGLMPTTRCDNSLPVSRAVMATMGGFDVQRSVAWLQEHGGLCCDCEVGFNVILPWQQAMGYVGQGE